MKRVVAVNKLHPTQKPLSVLTPLIQTFCRLGGLVLDPFTGSGSSLLAAQSIGRRFVGMEIDPAVHAVAERRLQAYRRALQQSLVCDAGDLRERDAQPAGAPARRRSFAEPSQAGVQRALIAAA